MMNTRLLIQLSLLAVLHTQVDVANAQDTTLVAKGNPLFTHKYTADPAGLVVGDRLYVYAGRDEAPNDRHFYEMHEWLVFSTTDLKIWTEHPVPLSTKDFSWSKGDAWASQVIERDGKFYWYVATEHKDGGKAIGIAVADRPEGPFKDALGKALITNEMTRATSISWDDIDPSVIIDDDGQAYLFWGNTACYYVKLTSNMTELAGDIQVVDIPKFTEAPWIHKRKGWYYLSYASEFPEKIVYAMSKSVHGPWAFKGIINEIAGNSNTNHQSIVTFKGKDLFIYHNGAINTHGGSYRRSVCIDELKYNRDGSIKRIVMTSEGVNSN